MVRTDLDQINLSQQTFDDLLSRALTIRDVLAGAAALLREASPSATAHELVAHGRNAAAAIVNTLEQEMAVAAERLRNHAQTVKHVGNAGVR